MSGTPCLLSLSGGIDSTTLYALLLSQGMDVTPVFFQYPSRHNEMERKAASRVAAYYEAESKRPLLLIDANTLFNGVHSNLFTGEGEIPSTSYNASSLALTVVPGRNLVFASILAAHAESLALREGDAVTLALGVHGGDHELYPDCRPEFIHSLRQTILLSSEGRVELIAPLVAMSKTEIVSMGLSLGVPYTLTRSCYNGTDSPCGVCATCRERADAFENNGVADPVISV